MRIYLVRHGEYLLNDRQKAGELSEKGITDLMKMVEFIKPLRLKVSNILHSGKTRAQQTADILAGGFDSDEPPQVFTGLNPEDEVDGMIENIRNWGSDVVLVGHLPFMSRFLGRILTEDETRETVVFHPGTIVCLEGENTTWHIQWVMTPELVGA